MDRDKPTQQNPAGRTSTPAFADQPPHSPAVTDYDREHLALYVRLLDAAEEGADWTEVVHVLFGIDSQREPERARRIHDSHLARARWMTEHGYQDLLRSAMH